VADTVLIPAGAPIVLNRFLRPNIFGTESIEAEAVAAEDAIRKPLAYLEGAVRDGGWLDGDFSVGDLAVACSIKTLGYTGWTLDATTYPKLTTWFERVGERPGWKAAAEREAAVFASLAH
jgi:glutathione S-transferase